MNKENSTPVPKIRVDTVAVPVYGQNATGDSGPETRDSGLATHDSPRRVGGQPGLSSEARVRKAGAQEGNQNARVHGFYSKKAPIDRRDVIDEAAELQGLDAEISFLRANLQYLSELSVPNPKLVAELVRTLSLVIVRRKYAGHNVLFEKAKRMLGGVGAAAGAAAGVVDIVQAVKE